MENKTQTLCRICFDLGHFSLNGYEINIQGKNLSIEEMIKRFSDIEFTDEHVPELICETCTQDLVQSYLFSEKVLESDAKIMNLAQLQEQEKLVVYEDELQSEQDDDDEVVSQDMEIENFEEQNMEIQEIKDIQTIEEQVITEEEEEHNDLIEEIHESNPPEDLYTESEVAGGNDHEEIICLEEVEETVSSSLQIDPSEEDVSNIPLNYDSFPNPEKEDEPIEPRKKYQRRNKTDNEIDKNGSFVITQFACSTTAPGTHINTNNDDTDEVAVSDVRIMNYETVEVKAGNIDIFNQISQSELPIDDSRVYLCQYCPRAFSTSAFLIAHVRKTHGCKFCASVFEKAKDLFAHIREAHAKFECVVCGKEFTSNSNMRNHLKNVHKVKVPANVSLLSYKKNSEVEEEI
ncbi:zinc finger protein 652 [Episyrphus balteatus]|uniref:zinc finger protein 652 n=1 Tax=Episyrphus balteatus TaxID=286459 RepID=UPI0024861F0E|nr:zinc finger protein 652 [Episyrphus balteatus]